MSDWIDAADWQTVVESVPVPSVDLVVVTDGSVVLAERTNQPAEGEWFVPGGRIQKGERIEEAVHRVARTELDVSVTIRERLGAYDHFYEVSDVPDTSKHYVAHGFVVETDGDPVTADDQHADVRVFESRPDDCHEYVAAYLDDASAVSL